MADYKLAVEEIQVLIKETKPTKYYNKKNNREGKCAGFGICYTCTHSNNFPEYTSNSNEDINPSHDATFNGWVL